MRTLTGRRVPAPAITGLACVVALVSGLLATGSAGPAGAMGRPVPASAIGQLTKIASRAARLNGDAHPAWVTVVATTHALALTSATPGDFVPGTEGVRVYLLTMQGHFTDNAASGPSGSKAPTGSYLSIVLNAGNFYGMDFGLSNTPPPVAPDSLGPVTYLSVGG
jgi:hypothetical protein